MGASRHCNQPLSPLAQTSQPHRPSCPSLPGASPRAVDVASGFADPQCCCCWGFFYSWTKHCFAARCRPPRQHVVRRLGSSFSPSLHSIALAGAPWDSELPSLPCFLHTPPARHWLQRIRLGAFSCRLTPLTWKRLAPAQPGPQLAAKGSADHPCGDRLCAANQTRKQFSDVKPIWMDIKVRKTLVASDARHLVSTAHRGPKITR